METKPEPRSDPSITVRRRWPTVLVAVLGTALFITASRYVNGDTLSVFGRTSGNQCVNGYCAEWVKYPELLLASGRTELHVFQKGHAADRFYSVPDPFDGDRSGVSMVYGEDGLSLTDGTVTVSWNADALARLPD